jgi:hypothetical protein
MIQVHLVLTRVPTPQGLEQHDLDRAGVYVDPRRIDTVTPIESDEQRRNERLPAMVRAVLRYDDERFGYRLMYVRDDAAKIARARRRELRGEDSDTMDWDSGVSA